MYFKKISVPIFTTDIKFVFVPDFGAKSIAFAARHLTMCKETIEELALDGTQAMTLMDREHCKHGILFAIPDNKIAFSIIARESVHLASMLIEIHGLPCSQENQ